MLHEEEALPRITTSCSDLDKILGGGISCRDVTEIGKPSPSQRLAATSSFKSFCLFLLQVECLVLARLRLGKTRLLFFLLSLHWSFYTFG